ncbi:MAG: 3',5'-cyclic-AMP phosphodiesterase [Pseudomonadota bacterium]|nr:3',5'-cyclic-AMP phosphodiesterase [Pseudomonadota bacterium]
MAADPARPTHAKDDGGCVEVVQVTDCHLFADLEGRLAGVQTDASLRAVLEHIDRHAEPDLLLLTGDLSQDETEPSYHRLLSHLKGRAPEMLWLPGNHDAPELMRRLGTLALNRVDLTLGRWRILTLNSHWAGHTEGRLAETELARLDAQLQAEPDLPTLVAVHHPPVPIGTPWLDAQRIVNGDALMECLGRFDQVRMLLCGHVHQAFSATHGGFRLMTSPSTCAQFAPHSDRFSLDTLGPGYRRLLLYPDGSHHTEVVRVSGDFSIHYDADGY